jgi:hypothetical protein
MSSTEANLAPAKQARRRDVYKELLISQTHVCRYRSYNEAHLVCMLAQTRQMSSSVVSMCSRSSLQKSQERKTNSSPPGVRNGDQIRSPGFRTSSLRFASDCPLDAWNSISSGVHPAATGLKSHKRPLHPQQPQDLLWIANTKGFLFSRAIARSLFTAFPASESE